MTAEEFLALPDEPGVKRWLINGRLREKPMTFRNRWHSRTEASIVFWLKDWLRRQPEPRGAIHSGEAGCRLPGGSNTIVGIDVVYVSSELAVSEPPDTTIIDGAPILAVEILSPSDTVESIGEKVNGYLAAGVAQVWLVDPYFNTVVMHRHGVVPRFFTIEDELTGDPELPGFSVPVRHLFTD